MNRMFLAVVTLGLSVTSAFAQAPPVAVAADADRLNAPKPPAVGTTKVAVFNLALVFNKYERAAAIKQEVAHDMKELQEEAKQLQQNLNVWQNALQKGDLPPAKRERFEEKVINARRRLEDLGREARAKVGKTQESNLIMLWKDIRDATNAYAKEHGLQLVIAYGDPKEIEQIDVFPNINRKMQMLDQGGAMPFFVAPGVDISEALVERLNRQYREKKADPAEQEDPK
jgi:Skp family chaperone for outer membrane proteins